MIKIRKAEQSDTSQLEELFLLTRQKTFSWESTDKFKLEDFEMATVGETIFVAEEDQQKIVGFISIWEHGYPAFIHHLYVSPDYQRKGIGEKLIRTLISRVPPPYRLKCVARNAAAVAFYLKNNWTEVSRGVSEEGEYLLLELKICEIIS